MKNEKLKGLRVITNLHCNYNCSMCYQVDKSRKILTTWTLDDAIAAYPNKHFEYATIMGGESTLLPDLIDYIRIAAAKSKATRLTTNGSLLTDADMQQFKKYGLTGLNISIPSFRHYHPLTGGGSLKHVISNLLIAAEIFGDENVRVNIALCKENVEGPNPELKELLAWFVGLMHFNVTLCEDILGTYSFYGKFDEIGCTVEEETNYGLILLKYAGHQIGYYTHRNSAYNDTDLVVTPNGTFTNWDGYCESVGHNVRKD